MTLKSHSYFWTTAGKQFFLGLLPPPPLLVLCNTFITFSTDDSPIHLLRSATSFVSVWQVWTPLCVLFDQPFVSVVSVSFLIGLICSSSLIFSPLKVAVRWIWSSHTFIFLSFRVSLTLFYHNNRSNATFFCAVAEKPHTCTLSKKKIQLVPKHIQTQWKHKSKYQGEDGDD